MSWVALRRPKGYVGALTPGTCECDLIRKYGVYRYNQLDGTIRMGPNPT